MDLSGYEVPRVLVSCRSRQVEVEGDKNENVPLYYDIANNIRIQFGRDEFCLVNGLRFGVENWADYDNNDVCIPLRRELVLLGMEGKRRVPDWMLRLANDRVAWDKYLWGSYVWPTLYSQLKNANVKRWPSLYAAQPTNEVDKKTYSIFGYTWAFKYYDRYNRYPRVAAWSKKKGRSMGTMVYGFFHENISAARLTQDETEARSDW
nr:hypothetical protein [Tanacetum cinerariifolium]